MRSTRTIDISTVLFVMLGFAAILFMVTSLFLAYFSGSGSSRSIMKGASPVSTSPAPQAPLPAAPAAPAAPAPAAGTASASA